MINDLAILARVREREIRNQLSIRPERPRRAGGPRHGAPPMIRRVVGLIGSALVAVGRRLETPMWEERPQHGA